MLLRGVLQKTAFIRTLHRSNDRVNWAVNRLLTAQFKI